jgi:hypothetical protein
MEISVLLNWLEHRGDYALGVKLYDSFGSDTSLKFLFGKTPFSTFNEQKLRKALRDVANDLPRGIVTKSAPVSTSGAKPKIKYDSLPAELKALYDENVHLLAQRQDLHSQLLHWMNDSDKLTEATTAILEMGKTMKNNWAVLDEFTVSGKIILKTVSKPEVLFYKESNSVVPTKY